MCIYIVYTYIYTHKPLSFILYSTNSLPPLHAKQLSFSLSFLFPLSLYPFGLLGFCAFSRSLSLSLTLSLRSKKWAFPKTLPLTPKKTLQTSRDSKPSSPKWRSSSAWPAFFLRGRDESSQTTTPTTTATPAARARAWSTTRRGCWPSRAGVAGQSWRVGTHTRSTRRSGSASARRSSWSP